MNPIEGLKKAPRWAWLTAAGVSAGVVGIRVWKGRQGADEAAEEVAGDGTPAGDAGTGSIQTATTGASPAGVIVPPVVMGGDGASASDLGAAFAQLTGGVIDTLGSQLGSVIAGNQYTTQQALGIIGQQSDGILSALANAGSAPQPVYVNPTPVVIQQAQPVAAPRVTAQKAQPVSKPKDTWKDVQRYNSKTKRCQTVRVHSDGREVVMSSKAGKC